MIKPVQQVLQCLHKIHTNDLFKVDELLEALDGVITHLDDLVSKHADKKYLDDYLASQCFSKAEFFNDAEFTAFSRVNLQLGVKYFKRISSEFKSEAHEGFKAKLKTRNNLLFDLMDDIRPFANYLEQRENPQYTFFEGSKASASESWALYDFSRTLYYGTTSHENPLQKFHRESHVASAFALRQALEVKFERIVGVKLYDRKGGEPRLRHGFHYDFVKAHMELFDFQGLEFDLVRKIYDWCSYIVHNACQPYIWQMPYAYEICHKLFVPGDYGPNGGWSIHGGVRVLDVGKMQTCFAKYLLDNYDHGTWCFVFVKPEAADFSKK